MNRIGSMTLVAVLIGLLSACGASEHDTHAHGAGDHATHDAAEHDHDSHAADEHDRRGRGSAEDAVKGAHGGRLLSGQAFDLELLIIEGDVEPHFRAYLSKDGRALAVAGAEATLSLQRLGRAAQTIHLRPEADYLTSSDVVFEPHSFAVGITARSGERSSRWTFDSVEGRTRIASAFAQRAGVRVENAGPATITESLPLYGTVELAAGGRAQVRARFPGPITAVLVSPGQTVKRGAALAQIESNDSLTNYSVRSPLTGTVAAVQAARGEMALEQVLFEIIDGSRLEAHLQVFPADLSKVRAGQAVQIRVAGAPEPIAAQLAGSVLRVNDRSQTIVIRAPLADRSGVLRPGLAITADVLIATHAVPLAVRVAALQTWRDLAVVFRQVEDQYEVQPVELGRRDREWVELLGGLQPGDRYVTNQSYLIKADIEKSGASHDH